MPRRRKRNVEPELPVLGRLPVQALPLASEVIPPWRYEWREDQDTSMGEGTFISPDGARLPEEHVVNGDMVESYFPVLQHQWGERARVAGEILWPVEQMPEGCEEIVIAAPNTAITPHVTTRSLTDATDVQTEITVGFRLSVARDLFNSGGTPYYTDTATGDYTPMATGGMNETEIWERWSVAGFNTSGTMSYTNTANTHVSQAVWLGWSTGANRALYYHVDPVWRFWHQQQLNAAGTRLYQQQLNAQQAPYRPDPEQMRRVQQRTQQAAEEQAQRTLEENERRRLADIVAKELLLSMLTPEQRESYERNGGFIIEVKGARYKLGFRGVGVAKIDDNEQELETLCIHPRESLPAADVLLGQKLLIEADEKRFRNIANITPVHRVLDRVVAR